ncbi:MAG: Pyridoxine/pyridoxamine 5'-phosphate oxidase [Alphaproteobacteria bacterium ADurb.BinA280]|jgi:pyridoxamine 5'-phosphate oxidase|nr:pyridoxamine 5'-phosphate oxidase [Xanthomonadales bacterium]MCC6504666.1 pyridoxamine 5'-phosphate oxidase [Aquimonas sp.]OPZ11481.1 MAG: Pyridoxine/pyridoxamine 5'-phosphate oxidase [Alphaproteobacteria bacterium ADurb.BinA280]
MTDHFAAALITFRDLLEEARSAGDPEPTAMSLATVDDEGQPSCRTVLLKDFDERGFVFYTNTESRKGQQLHDRPKAALLFLWKTLRHQVQVKIEGRVESVSREEADAYFASRPRGSQLGAWASQQSRALDHRETLDQRLVEFEREFEGREVTRPPYWSGYRVVPHRIEFWYGVPYRLHDRHEYRRVDGEWHHQLLYP